jgi:hypothetical protein
VMLYEDRLSQDGRWALSEGSRHFEGRSAVQDALRKITSRLRDLNIPYAVAGGMALFQHGHRRFTEDVDLLVTPDGLRAIHEHLDGLGYVPPFKNSKHLRDTENGVRVEFIVAGQFPGDGKPKPVAFPDPESSSIEMDGIRYLSLPSLVELKLASGMTNPGRLKDLGDVQELIRLLKLSRDFSAKLNPYVAPEYEKQWENVKSGQSPEE